MASLLRSLVLSISVGLILYIIYPFLPASAGLRRVYVAVVAAVLFFVMGLLFKKAR
jgi:hypothetical protein